MSFSLLLKPASSDCNLRCRYCYYRGTELPASAAEKRSPRMSDAVLEKTLSSYLATEQDIYSMVWHGGEPSLMPCSFYEKAIALQKHYAVQGSRISNSIQTNGTLISAQLASFMARYRFLCGVSLDGQPHIHNLHRKNKTGNGTHHQTLQGITTLTNAGVPTNILALVSSANINNPLEVYRYLKQKGFSHIQFIPCIEDDDNGKPSSHSIDAEQWGVFLISVFNEWYQHDTAHISIRLFESILARLVYNVAIDCYNSGACNRYLVVEHNGDIYPCDFFVKDEYKLGNIMEDSFGSILESSAFKSFSAKKKSWHKDCDKCEFKKLCMGDCLKFRMTADKRFDTISRLCPGWKRFYGATLDRFKILAERVERM